MFFACRFADVSGSRLSVITMNVLLAISFSWLQIFRLISGMSVGLAIKIGHVTGQTDFYGQPN